MIEQPTATPEQIQHDLDKLLYTEEYADTEEQCCSSFMGVLTLSVCLGMLGGAAFGAGYGLYLAGSAYPIATSTAAAGVSVASVTGCLWYNKKACFSDREEPAKATDNQLQPKQLEQV